MVTLHKFEVGKLYSPGVTAWPEILEYNYRGDTHEMIAFLADPTSKEIREFQSAQVRLGLFVEPPLLSLAVQIGDFDGDAPYTWHKVKPEERTVPPVLTGEQRATLQLLLVDAATGILKVFRLLTFSHEASNVLHAAIREQSDAPWNPAAYQVALSRYQTNFPTTKSIMKRSRSLLVMGR